MSPASASRIPRCVRFDHHVRKKRRGQACDFAILNQYRSHLYCHLGWNRFSICIFQFTIRNAYDPTTFPFADPAALNPMTTPPLPEQIELHRDRMWRRDEDLRIESAFDAERFIEDVGFANTLTDARRAGPSLSSRFDSQRIANSDA